MADNPEPGEMFNLLAFGSGSDGGNFWRHFLKEHRHDLNGGKPQARSDNKEPHPSHCQGRGPMAANKHQSRLQFLNFLEKKNSGLDVVNLFLSNLCYDRNFCHNYELKLKVFVVLACH